MRRPQGCGSKCFHTSGGGGGLGPLTLLPVHMLWAGGQGNKLPDWHLGGCARVPAARRRKDPGVPKADRQLWVDPVWPRLPEGWLFETQSTGWTPAVAHKPTRPWTLLWVLCWAFWHLCFDSGAPSKSHYSGADGGLCVPASRPPGHSNPRKAVSSLGVAASRGLSQLPSAPQSTEVRGPILNIWWRSVTSEWEDASLASWSGLREAQSSGALVLQLVTCNLESFFSSFRI